MTVMVLEFKREGWRDAVSTLRKIADDLESSEKLLNSPLTHLVVRPID
ncbi:hypothetical protein [Pseudomonas sp. QTF5]|nr:hypothetical protein [Pseudomonas sp. QTF5]